MWGWDLRRGTLIDFDNARLAVAFSSMVLRGLPAGQLLNSARFAGQFPTHILTYSKGVKSVCNKRRFFLISHWETREYKP